MRRWAGNVLRSARVTIVAAKHMAAYRLRPTTEAGASSGPQHFRAALEELGASFIKFGQLMALQPDILPQTYCSALFDLLDRVPSFPFEHVERTFIEDLGAEPDHFFDSFQRVPMASASIGQVHVAELDGRRFAVKVRRPEAETEFGTDLQLFRTVAATIVRLRLRRLRWLVKMIQELTHWTNEELDYRCEARYMVALGHNARDSTRERVPELLAKLSSRRILTAEFLDGPTVLDYIRHLETPDPELEQRLRGFGFQPEQLARNVIENFVHDAFEHGLFHADLHPANLLILPNNVIGYVDFGITGSLSSYSRRQIVGMTLALTRADLDGMRRHFLKVSTIDEFSDVAAFRREFRRLSRDWYDPDATPPRLSKPFTIIMLEMLRLSRRTGVFSSPDTIRYLRSVISTEGLIRQFAPDFEVAPHVEAVCTTRLRRQAMRQWWSPSLADWLVSGTRLLTQAPSSLASYLAPLDDADLSAIDARAADRHTAPKQRRRVFIAAATAIVAAALAALTGQHATLGWNLFTVEVVIATAAIVQFVYSVGRLAGSGSG